MLVDTKLANNGEAILNQVRTVTDKPVSMIINTHSHPDHIGSNDYFPASVEKVTHENTKKWMAANAQYASNPAVMPDRTFTDTMTLGSGKDRDRPLLLRRRATPTATRSSCSRRCARCASATSWPGRWRRSSIPRRAAASIALPDTLEKALKGIKNVDTVIEGHGDVNTWAGFRDYAQFNRALLDAAKAGLGKQTPEEIAASLKPKFPVFTKEELLTDLEYGGTPLSRAVINVNVAFQELRGEPVTTNFGGRAGAGCTSRAWPAAGTLSAPRFRNVTGTLPWVLFSTATMELPSADSSPVIVHGCVLGSSKFIRRPSP